MRCALVLLFALTASAATLKPIVPKDGPKPVGPYSPGIDAGAFVYVSGQGARDATGRLPAGIEDQTRQCLSNVKQVLDAAGLTFEHVVWAPVFFRCEELRRDESCVRILVRQGSAGAIQCDRGPTAGRDTR